MEYPVTLSLAEITLAPDPNSTNFAIMHCLTFHHLFYTLNTEFPPRPRLDQFEPYEPTYRNSWVLKIVPSSPNQICLR